jgi:hypothetical protein
VKLTLIDQTRLFLAGKGQSWGARTRVEDEALSLWLRISRRPGFHGLRLDIADAAMPEEERGRGRLTRFLDTLEEEQPLAGIPFSSVGNPRLRRYLLRRGYAKIELAGYEIAQDYVKDWGTAVRP